MALEKKIFIGALLLNAAYAIVVVSFLETAPMVPYFNVPIGLKWATSLVILTLLSVMFPYQKSALALLWAGFLSNGLFYSIFGSHLDVIPTGFSYINTADLVIGIGCIVFLKEGFISLRQQS